MSIEIIVTCDERGCRNRIDEGDECYCKDCYCALLARIEDLEKELSEKEEK